MRPRRVVPPTTASALVRAFAVALSIGAVASCGFYAELGAQQDARNRALNAQNTLQPPRPTDNEQKGAAIDAQEGNSFVDFVRAVRSLFAPQYAKIPFHDLPRCLDDEVWSCSADGTCRCRIDRIKAAAQARAIDPDP